MRKLRKSIRRIKEQIRFWIYKRLKGGVVYFGKDKTLFEAYNEVRSGGYVIGL